MKVYAFGGGYQRVSQGLLQTKKLGQGAPRAAAAALAAAVAAAQAAAEEMPPPARVGAAKPSMTHYAAPYAASCRVPSLFFL